MITYVFPGQGSQKKGMGAGLFDEFADMTRAADDILGYSIKELCLSDPGKKLNQTAYTQPALYVTGALSYRKKIEDGGKVPDFTAGHSLGEYNALYAAGAFSFEDGLRLVKKRGELMSRAGEGAMAAIINSSEKQIREILEEAGLHSIDIANLNALSQIVISGLKEEVARAQPYFEKAKAMFIPLNTSGAFHSRHMKEAEAEFEKFIKDFTFSPPRIPVIANVTAKPYIFEEIAQNLIHQISHCVRWTDSIIHLLDLGEMEFEELGAGDVLTKLIKKIRKEWATEKSHAELTRELESRNEAPKPPSPRLEQLDGKELVEYWNKNYPVGTRVLSQHYDAELETRTEAMVLFGHRAAVYMKGYNGYFDLREVKPVQ